MNSREFIEKLNEIRYPGGCGLLPENFDWLFHDKNTSSFVKIFCERISAANFVSSDELDIYKSISENDAVLEENEAFPLLDQFEKSNNQIGEEKKNIGEKLEAVKKKREEVADLKKIFEQNLEKANLELTRVNKLHGKVWMQNQELLHDCAKSTDVVNQTLKDLVEELTKTKCVFFKAFNSPDSEHIFAQNCLDRFLKTEQKVNNSIKTTLTNFITARSLIRDLDANGTDKQIFESIKQDEMKLLDASLKAVSAQAASEALQSELKMPITAIDEKRQAKYLKDIHKDLERITKDKDRVYKSAQEMVEDKARLFHLQWEVDKLDLILERRLCLDRLLDQVKGHIVGQYTRCDTIYACFSAKKQQLSTIVSLCQECCKLCMSQVEKQHGQMNTKVALDKFSSAVKQSQSNPISPKQSSEVTEVSENILQVRKSICNHLAEVYEKLTKLEEAVELLESKLWDGDSDRSCPPNPAPLPVTLACSQLQERLSTIEEKAASNSESYQEKQKILKKDPVLVQQRSLFSLFHTNPSLLKKVVEELEARNANKD